MKNIDIASLAILIVFILVIAFMQNKDKDSEVMSAKVVMV